MMLSVVAVLLGAAVVWRGRVEDATDAASLRVAIAAINRQALVLAVMFLVALMPTLRIGTDVGRIGSLAVAGVFALVLFVVRARWQNRARESWVSAAQAMLVRAMMRPAPVVVMPVRLREAA